MVVGVLEVVLIVVIVLWLVLFCFFIYWYGSECLCVFFCWCGWGEGVVGEGWRNYCRWKIVFYVVVVVVGLVRLKSRGW